MSDTLQTAIFGPFFATMLLTAVVWVYMYVRRIRFLTQNEISSTDMAVRFASPARRFAIPTHTAS